MPRKKKKGICQNPIEHRPRYKRTVWHHLIPLMWDGQDVDENTVESCDNCHYSCHVLIDAAVDSEEEEWPAQLATGYSFVVRGWAKTAWENRPTEPTPTLAAWENP